MLFSGSFAASFYSGHHLLWPHSLWVVSRLSCQVSPGLLEGCHISSKAISRRSYSRSTPFLPCYNIMTLLSYLGRNKGYCLTSRTALAKGANIHFLKVFLIIFVCIIFWTRYTGIWEVCISYITDTHFDSWICLRSALLASNPRQLFSSLFDLFLQRKITWWSRTR